MSDLTLLLNSPITEEQWDMITDVDFEHTSAIEFATKHGKKVTFYKERPSAQPERKSGEWIHDGVKRICPFCKDFIVTGRSTVKYCWNCGARLEERREDKMKINASQAGYIGGWEIKADTRCEEDECNN